MALGLSCGIVVRIAHESRVCFLCLCSFLPSPPSLSLSLSAIMRVSILLSLVALLAAFSVADASLFRKSALPVLPSFNITQFVGRFFEAYSDLSVHGTFERDGVCIFADYGLLSNGSVSVHNRMNVGSANGTLSEIRGHATPDGSGVPGHLAVTLGTNPFAAPYWIIATGPVVNDSYDYIIVTDGLQLTLWVLVRNIETFFDQYGPAVLGELQQLGFSNFWNAPIKTNQTGCVYGPADKSLNDEGAVELEGLGEIDALVDAE